MPTLIFFFTIGYFIRFLFFFHPFFFCGNTFIRFNLETIRGQFHEFDSIAVGIMGPELDAFGITQFKFRINGRSPGSYFRKILCGVFHLKTDMGIADGFIPGLELFGAVGENFDILTGSHKHVDASQLAPLKIVHAEGFFHPQHIPVKGNRGLNILGPDSYMT
jgi:hypothetical protein